MGILYLVSTPLGNLEDISSRAARVLGEVGAVLAEDTRRTGVLMRHLGLTTPLVSLHAHNEETRVAEVLSRLEGRGTLALVSDAGTPLVSDPGERIVRRVLEDGHDVVPIPGPSAVLHALVGSGLPTVPFVFLGFVPRKGRPRGEILDRVAESAETAVLFEAPERTATLLSDLARRCGESREAAVGRELTKVYEEFRRGTLGELARYYSRVAPRGEVTVVVAPRRGEPFDASVDEMAGRALAGALLGEGVAPSRVARELARRLGIPRNQAYELVLGLSAREAEGGEAASEGEALPETDTIQPEDAASE